LSASYGTTDVTEKVRDLIEQGSNSILASNSVFGDPWPNVIKTLTITYEKSGVVKTLIAKESENLTFANPP